MNKTFTAFYSDLYKSDTVFDKNKCELLAQFKLPKLSEEDALSLAKEISLAELKDAVAGMQTGKSPGLDGIPPEFYSSTRPMTSGYDQFLNNQGWIFHGCKHCNDLITFEKRPKPYRVQ